MRSKVDDRLRILITGCQAGYKTDDSDRYSITWALVRNPLLISFQLLVAVPTRDLFFLPSKKDFIKFRALSQKPYAFSLAMCNIGCTESKALLMSVDKMATVSPTSLPYFQSSTSRIKVVSQLYRFGYADIELSNIVSNLSLN